MRLGACIAHCVSVSAGFRRAHPVAVRSLLFAQEGIFQATMFTCKPEHMAGLKTGSYLVSLDACREFEAYFTKR